MNSDNFDSIAKAIRVFPNYDERKHVAYGWATMCEELYPKEFDRTRFLKACEVPEEEEE